MKFLKINKYISLWMLVIICVGTDLKLVATDQNKATPAFRMPEKDWTFITYMAADNDLAQFSRKNLIQQASIGSNSNINILVHLDTKTPAHQKITKRYYVEKDKLLLFNPENETAHPPMDSGDPHTLIDCCRWAITNFPAKNYALVLWNHGTGIIDIGRPRTINPASLYSFNPINHLLELDRSKEFLDFYSSITAEDPKGICFDDSTGHYLTNQGLEYALRTICTNYLGGNKFSIIAFDACLMSMLEIGNIVKEFADFMVSSQEVELGPGYPYEKILEPFTRGTFKKEAFAHHMVTAYKDTYSKITNDFTQSALDLTHIHLLESNVDQVAELLLAGLKIQKNNTIDKAIRLSRHKMLCTHFDEPSYIDLHHFYSNLLENLASFEYMQPNAGDKINHELSRALKHGCELIIATVFANATGKNLHKARGISIYFPERRIHTSYSRTNFAKSTKWLTFLSTFLSIQ